MAPSAEQSIGPLLRDLRRALGRSQNEQASLLSELAGRPITRHEVSRWEHETRLPTPYWQRHVAASFDVLVDTLRAAVQRTKARRDKLNGPTSTTGNPDPFSDQELGALPATFLADTSVRTPVPTRIGWTEVDHVRSTTRALALSENMFGGGLSGEAASAQLRWAGDLLEAQAAGDVRRAMYETVGNLSAVVAFSAFDVANYVAADRCFQFALWCADQSGSWALRANTLAEMARKAVYLGDVDEALTLIEFAQVRSDRVTATARAMLWALHARMLAVSGRAEEAIADVERADEAFVDSDPTTDPAWLCYYDQAEHQGSTGKALIPLAQQRGTPELATLRLERAVAAQHADYPRSRTFSRTRLATLLMNTGHPNDAVGIGHHALTDAGQLRSHRVDRELRRLAQAAAPYRQRGDVADLCDRITVLAGTGA